MGAGRSQWQWITVTPDFACSNLSPVAIIEHASLCRIIITPQHHTSDSGFRLAGWYSCTTIVCGSVGHKRTSRMEMDLEALLDHAVFSDPDMAMPKHSAKKRRIGGNQALWTSGNVV